MVGSAATRQDQIRDAKKGKDEQKEQKEQKEQISETGDAAHAAGERQESGESTNKKLKKGGKPKAKSVSESMASVVGELNVATVSVTMQCDGGGARPACFFDDLVSAVYGGLAKLNGKDVAWDALRKLLSLGIRFLFHGDRYRIPNAAIHMLCNDVLQDSDAKT